MIKYLGKSRFKSGNKDLFQAHFFVSDKVSGYVNTYTLFIDEALFNKLLASDMDKECQLIAGINYRGLTLVDIDFISN